MTKSRDLLVLAFLTATFAVASACKTSVHNDPILSLGAKESLAEGKELMAAEKYNRARPYLIHAFEVEPNSVTGREGLLLAADTYYLEGTRANYLQAEAKYRDFINRFPTSDRAAYAQFQVAASLAKRMERPDRDQSTARDALRAYDDLLRLYPTSEYAAQAREEIRLVKDNLAEHEFLVGKFYLRFGIPVAAVSRFEFLLENYRDYGAKDKVLFHLAQAYSAAKREEDAVTTYKRLRQQFPDSPFLKDAPPESAEGTVPVAPPTQPAPGGQGR